jgi:hypothetical protein
MQHFSIGLSSVLFSAMFALAVLARYAGAFINAWYRRESPPKDRIMVGILAAAAFGFITGSFLQPAWERIELCEAGGHALVSCVINPNAKL